MNYDPGPLPAELDRRTDAPTGTAVSLPRPGAPVTLEQMEDAERQIAVCLPTMNDIGEIEEQRDRIAALETYLRGKQAHLPAVGAQRRLEARIGQLLPAEQGKRTDIQHTTHAEEVVSRPGDKADFRVLARALNGKCELSNDDWRQSRRALVAHVKELTKEDDEAMLAEEIERTIKADTKPNNVMTFADGMSAEQATRKAMVLEEEGLSADDAGREIGVHVRAYRRMRAVIMLHDRGGLSRRDTKLVDRALLAMNQTNQVSGSWGAVEPIAEKVWGSHRSAPIREIEPKRFEKFDYAFGLVMQACEDAADMDLPYLSEDRANDAAKQLAVAAQHLRDLRERIMRIHS